MTTPNGNAMCVTLMIDKRKWELAENRNQSKKKKWAQRKKKRGNEKKGNNNMH